MTFFGFILILECVIQDINGAMSYLNDLETNTVDSGWMDLITDEKLEIQYDNNKNIHYIQKQLQVYFEFEISGITEEQELIIYGNNQIVYYNLWKFESTQLLNGNSFKSQVYFQINQPEETLILKITINQINLNLYIYNILLNRYYKEYPLTFIYQEAYNPTCATGLYFYEYCQCQSPLIFESTQCVNQCSSGFLQSILENECYSTTNCNLCTSNNLVCNNGYYKMNEGNLEQFSCVTECPSSTILISNSCVDLVEYLSTTENNGYDIDHFQFFTYITNFLHFYMENWFETNILTTPEPIRQKQIFFQNNRFYIGTNEVFQSQIITLKIKILQSQHKLRFKAIGNFLNFNPTKNEVIINGIKQSSSQIFLKEHYQTQYDYVWQKQKDAYPLNEAEIKISIEQPLINGQYKGIFYLDEIHLFSFQCIPGCASCHILDYCTPCTNPNHKNPSDCTCLSGYLLKNDICVFCPTYCITCVDAYACSKCVTSTKRVNPPSCTTCIDGYFVKAGIDECQPCNPICKRCLTENECTACNNNLFRNDLKQCVVDCPDGFYNDLTNPSDLKCSLCDAFCLTCKDDSYICTSCRQYEVLIENQCFSCPVGFYFLISECQPCIDNCERCTSTKCVLCNDTYYYYPVTGECLNDCPIGYLQNNNRRKCELCDVNCQTCIAYGSADCLTCKSNKVMNWINELSGECLDHCRDGYYKNDYQCSLCWKGCQTCIDNTQQCLICAKGYYRFELICQDYCPDGYYKDKIQMVCNKCNENCKTCLNYQYCLTCSLQLALEDGICVTDCKLGYGNINQICKPCTDNCEKCFGINPNECLQCNRGYYFLQNQCYWKCPIHFIHVRPQYICKCPYNDCIVCKSNEYYLNNICYNNCPQRYYGYNGLCIQCDVICLTCFGEQNDQCLSCDNNLILFKSQCVTECLGNTYHDIITNSCKYCHLDCLSCDGPNDNNCTSCSNQLLLSQEGQCNNYCPDNQYPVLQEYRCYNCHSSCKTCFSKSYQNCLTCNNYFYLYECVDSCPDGFKISINKIQCEIDNIIIIPQCSYQCQTCQFVSRYCKTCASNRIANPPYCDCENGYYDNGIDSKCPKCSNKCLSCKDTSTNCLICKGDRLLPNCICPFQSYDDNESVYCNKCQDNCLTCNNNGCITCLNNRINPPYCVCQDGYVEEYKSYCTQCYPQCQTCIISPLICLSCKSIRINPPLCQCPDGYFENSEYECQQCNPVCKECNQFGCVTCFGNRIGPSEGVCTCDTPGYSRIDIGSNYCTDCMIGVPYIQLNNDFLGFKIDFGGPFIQLSYGCKQIFEQETLDSLGNKPICDKNAIILFGSNSTIQIGQLIKLKLNIFKLEDCQLPFQQIIQMPLSLPYNIDIKLYKPQLIFKQLINPSVCQSLQIEIEDTLYNAKQKIKILNWQMLLPNEQNNQILQILNQNTLNGSYTITFPPQLFKKDVLYKFQVKIKSFAQLENLQYFQFIPKLFSVVTFKPIIKSLNINRNESITIQGIIEYNNCQEINPPSQILYYSIVIQNNQKQLYQGQIKNNLYDGFTLEIQHNIQPYFFNVSKHYIIEFKTKLVRQDYTYNNTNVMDIYVLYNDPTIKILGGNRMVGFDQDLELQTSISDPDTQDPYICKWQCLDLITNQDCLNHKNELIILNPDCQQFIKKKTFEPYQVFFFIVSIFKENKQYSSKISIQMMEISLPILTVIGPDTNKLHNYYDEILFQLQYPGINPDFLMYAGAIIYDSVVQASFEFFYLDLKFKLQDYFTQLNQENYIRLRLSVYDPHFILPSLNTQILLMNIPPQQCQIVFQYIEVIVEFLDKVQFNVINCQSQSTKIMYSAWLYENQSIYQEELRKSYFHHFLLLSENQENPQFNLQFPYYEQALLIILIKEDKGGISNVTKEIQIKQYQNLTQQTFESYLQEKQQIDEKLIGYNIVSERLSRLIGLNSYKEQILSYLTNLSLIGNQSVIQYQAISYLINNSQILQQQDFLNKVRNQIKLIGDSLINLSNNQKQQLLTSQNNIERELYLKQYYILVDILSKYLVYRVQKNESSNDIINLLTEISDKLQNISVANQPIYNINSQYIITDIGYLTTKRLNQILDSNEQQSESKFSLQFTRFKANPYYSEEGFPKNSSGYEAFNPRILNDTQNVSKLNSSLSYQFPQDETSAENISLKCITQINTTTWNSSVCKTVQLGINIICECEVLSPVTVMQTFDDIFDKANEVYNLDTLLLFLKYPIYKAIAFYFYLTLTLCYLGLVWWGVRVDNSMFTKIAIHEDVMEVKIKIRRNAVNDVKEEQSDPIFQKTQTSPMKITPSMEVQQNAKLNTEENAIFNTEENQTIFNLKQPKKKQQLLQINNLIDQHKTNTSIFQNLEVPKEIKLELTPLQQYIEFLKYFHQILSIYYKDDQLQPRGLRASVLYTSTVGSLAMHFLFNDPQNISFNIAIMLIVAPANKIYQLILQKGLSHRKKGIRQIATGFMILSAGYISYTMLAGLMLSESIEEANTWSGIFVGSFVLDNFIYSPIQLFFQQRLFKWLLSHKKYWKYGKQIVDEKGREMIKQLYN